MNNTVHIQNMLDAAQSYADAHSTCVKVKVGSVIEISTISRTHCMPLIYGCNHGLHNCKDTGCRRIELYGENSKGHRLPSDCDAIHSEIDAICNCSRSEFDTNNAIIYVTRYPCEACARAIVAAGINKVIYGRKESISDYTEQILKAGHVKIEHADWNAEDNNA